MRESGCRKSYTLVFCLFLKRKTSWNRLKPEEGFLLQNERPEHKEQISLCPCQKLTQYWEALKGFESHRKCLLVPHQRNNA